MSGINLTTFGTCNAYGCDEVLPWDMAAIGVNGWGYCSPECAKNADVDSLNTVCLHDPQYHGKRPDGVDGDTVDVWREFAEGESLAEGVDSVAELYPHEFRP